MRAARFSTVIISSFSLTELHCIFFQVLFRYAIAIFKSSEDSLLSVDDSISIFNRLRTMAQDNSEVQKLTQVNYCLFDNTHLECVQHVSLRLHFMIKCFDPSPKSPLTQEDSIIVSN